MSDTTIRIQCVALIGIRGVGDIRWQALASSSAPTSEFLKREGLQLTKKQVKEVERRGESKD